MPAIDLEQPPMAATNPLDAFVLRGKRGVGDRQQTSLSDSADVPGAEREGDVRFEDGLIVQLNLRRGASRLKCRQRVEQDPRRELRSTPVPRTCRLPLSSERGRSMAPR